MSDLSGYPERDHGLGDKGGEPTAPPAVLDKLEDQICPNCKGKTLFMIEVAMSNPLLKGGGGTGVYVGCAACPYASPMMTRAEGSES